VSRKSKLRNDQIILMDDERYVGKVTSRREIYSSEEEEEPVHEQPAESESEDQEEEEEEEEKNEELEKQLAKMEQDEQYSSFPQLTRLENYSNP
jgi:molecular chaperone GrpE (heat shock protein)